jgi:hypothetical protein
MDKVEIALTDGTWLEGDLEEDSQHDIPAFRRAGVWLNNVHRGKKEGDLPIGKRVFVPYPAMLFVILEK